MKIIIEIIKFELRQQLKSPFVIASLLVFFMIHLLSITSTGVTLWTHPRADMNSAYAIGVVETSLTVFAILPVMGLVVNIILRDFRVNTIDFFSVKPISKAQFIGGRFAAASLLSVAMGFAGIAGSLVGTLMPWMDESRTAPFSVQPFVFIFFTIVLPNMVILCTLLCSAALITRTVSGTTAAALVIIVADVLLASLVMGSNAGNNVNYLSLADHSATLMVNEASRNLTVTELNELYPEKMLLENRLVWLFFSAGLFLLAAKQFHFSKTKKRTGSLFRKKKINRIVMQPPGYKMETKTSFANISGSGIFHSSLLQFIAQFKADTRSVLRSPLFLIILLLGVVSAIVDYTTHTGPVMNIPLYPLTGSMLDFFRVGILHLVLVIIIYYSGVLVHRDRESAVDEMLYTSPAPDWIFPVSKSLSLCIVVIVLLFVLMLTSMGLQITHGSRPIETGLYLRTVFLYNGFYYCMLCILAVLIQILVQHKWSGMLVVMIVSIFLFSLESFGWEHILYRFTIPHMPYSDMNGYGYRTMQVHALIAYWGCFCGILVITGHLFFRRGIYSSFKERMKIAAARMRKPVVVITVLFFTCFIGLGSWIYYNTNKLNNYQTEKDIQQAAVSYEKQYGRYENSPAPSFSKIDICIDIFPSERRLKSSGKAKLTNNKNVVINEFVLSVNLRMKVDSIYMDSALLIKADAAQGFYLFKPYTPLVPGKSLTLHWHMSRINRGFPNSNFDNEVLENGTFVTSEAIMPIPGIDDTRKITDNAIRNRFQLPAVKKLPALGDTMFLDKISYGIDSRTDFKVTVSTEEGQTAVTSGKLSKEWKVGGRNYFEYTAERPVWPRLFFTSANYQVAREVWKGADQQVGIELYYHPEHSYNATAMLNIIRHSLDYFTKEFGPYPYSVFKIMEYPSYRKAAKALPGGAVAYSEAVGWLTDISVMDNIDFTTIHELSHMWWGDQAYGAKMQGREMLNESLAQYSTLIVFKKICGDSRKDILHRIIANLQKGYLAGRSKDKGAEQPVIYTEDQSYISYGKGALALFTLQELVGEEKVNKALRNYLSKFAFQPPPFPASRNLVDELRAVAGSEYQGIITDLFEKIMLYDVNLTNASIKQVPDGYEIVLSVQAHQFEADGLGKETERPLNMWFDIGLFANSGQSEVSRNPLYLQKYLLKTGENIIKIKTTHKPAFAMVDPFQKLPDRDRDNNKLSWR